MPVADKQTMAVKNISCRFENIYENISIKFGSFKCWNFYMHYTIWHNLLDQLHTGFSESFGQNSLGGRSRKNGAEVIKQKCFVHDERGLHFMKHIKHRHDILLKPWYIATDKSKNQVTPPQYNGKSMHVYIVMFKALSIE